MCYELCREAVATEQKEPFMGAKSERYDEAGRVSIEIGGISDAPASG